MDIYTLEHLYDFLRKEHGNEFVELTQKLIDEHVSRETFKIKNNVEILSDGFISAMYKLEQNNIDYLVDTIIKADKLIDLIYTDIDKPNYEVDVGD